jgi:nucleoside-diphosphate-sugar epimerase
MDRPILITGSYGFLGSHLRRRLPASAPLWLGSGTTDATIAALRPRTIYHLAAIGVSPHDRDMRRMLDHNVARYGELLDAVRRHAPDCHIISAGSCFDDDVNDYGHTKRLAREMSEYYRTHGLRVAVLRFFQVFGPGEPAFRFVPSVIRACLRGDTVEIGGGKQMRSWLYIEDAIEALLQTTHSLTEDVGGDYLSVEGMATRIINVLGAHVQVSTNAPPRDDATRHYRSALSVYSVTPLDEGIRAHGRSLGWTG